MAQNSDELLPTLKLSFMVLGTRGRVRSRRLDQIGCVTLQEKIMSPRSRFFRHLRQYILDFELLVIMLRASRSMWKKFNIVNIL